MKNTVTLESFLFDVKDHQMKALLDNGVHRHLEFQNKNGSWNQRFSLTTWPGYLCFSGDMGCFVFSRVDDMFRFFRCDSELTINRSYWAEKLQAVDRSNGFQEYSYDKFCTIVRDHMESYIEDRMEMESMNPDEEERVRMEIDQLLYDVDCGGDEHHARQAINDYELSEEMFPDFWEADLKEYTDWFLWCCWAIVWGIQQYDMAKMAVEVEI